MGYDPKLFVDPVDEELKCPICQMILEKPVCGLNCNHLYCDPCIRAWLKRSRTCPLDRSYLTEGQLKPGPRLIVNLLKNLEAKCPNYIRGCCWTVKLDDLLCHLGWCPFTGSSEPDSGEVNVVRQLRNVCDKREDLEVMKDMVEKLRFEMEDIVQCSEKLKECVKEMKENTQDVVRYIQYAQSQMIRVILCSEDQNRLVSDLKLDNYLVNCTVVNLGEFMTEDILMEYLRQNGMRPVKCVLDSFYFSRSRNFRVTARLSDLEKLTDPDIWPVGVIIAVGNSNLTNGRAVISGKRSRGECALFLEAGGTYE